jgi:hypothetical protein
MNMKVNCWEVKKCGREPGGLNTKELGICPAAIEIRVNRVNSGKNGGRCCWTVAGTLCGGKVQGSAALKTMNCMNCEFYKSVWKEEHNSGTYKTPAEILRILQ